MFRLLLPLSEPIKIHYSTTLNLPVFFFKSLAIHELRVYAQANDAKVFPWVFRQLFILIKKPLNLKIESYFVNLSKPNTKLLFYGEINLFLAIKKFIFRLFYKQNQFNLSDICLVLVP